MPDWYAISFHDRRVSHDLIDTKGNSMIDMNVIQRLHVANYLDKWKIIKTRISSDKADYFPK